MKGCIKCGETKDASLEFFSRDKYSADGLASRCKVCASSHTKEWRKTVHGAAITRFNNYRTSDKRKGFENDLTLTFVASRTQDPCDYCGTTDFPRGLDRLDNSLGHQQTNVVPCCEDCNIARGARFSPAQMRVIGPAIAQARIIQ
jgi:hypothetical protein